MASKSQDFALLESPRTLKNQWKQSLLAWTLVAVTGAWFAGTIVYSLAVSSTTGLLQQFLPLSHGPTVTVRILRILSEGTSILFAALVSTTLDALLWAVASAKRGVSMSTLLSLSQSTQLFGLLELLFLWRRARSGGDFHVLVAIFRLFLTVLLPVMAIVILSTVEYTNTYVTQQTLNVTSGLGPFNASMADDYDDSFLALQYTSLAHNLVWDTTVSVTLDPPLCHGTPSCTSYFLVGGLAWTDPNPRENATLGSGADTIIIRQTQGLLASFWPLSPESVGNFNTSKFDCFRSGVEEQAIQICLAASKTNASDTVAVWSVCSNAQCASNAKSWENTVHVGLTLALQNATADTYYSRENSTILQIQNLSTDNPPYAFTTTDYLRTISRIFHLDIDPTTGKLNPNFTSTQLFVHADMPFADPYSAFQNALLTPFLMFQASSFLNSWSIDNSAGELSDIPSQLYTTADLVKTVPRGIIAPWTVFVFLALGCLVYCICIGCLLWSMTIQGPPTTRFQLLDFASRIVSNRTPSSLGDLLATTANGDNKYMRSRLMDEHVYLGGLGRAGDVRSFGLPADTGSFLSTERQGMTIGFSRKADVVALKCGETYV